MFLSKNDLHTYQCVLASSRFQRYFEDFLGTELRLLFCVPFLLFIAGEEERLVFELLLAVRLLELDRDRELDFFVDPFVLFFLVFEFDLDGDPLRLEFELDLERPDAGVCLP